MTGRWKKVHSVDLKQAMERLHLLLSVRLVDHLLCRLRVIEIELMPPHDLAPLS